MSTAIEQQVDAFLIAGDLFDSDRISFETEALVLSELVRLDEASIQVVYTTGNHDPGTPRSRVLGMSIPANVTLLADGTPRRVPILGSDGQTVGFVTGAGHDSPSEARDLADLFPSPVGEVAEVALLHTQVTGSRDEACPRALCTLGARATRTVGVRLLGARTRTPPTRSLVERPDSLSRQSAGTDASGRRRKGLSLGGPRGSSAAPGRVR